MTEISNTVRGETNMNCWSTQKLLGQLYHR